MSQVDAIVLLSGGLDSAANLALAHDQGWKCFGLTVNYGQRAWQSERKAAHEIAVEYGTPVRELDLQFVGELGGSALTDTARIVPEIARDDLDAMPVISQTADAVWVPNRNGVLVNCAAAWAEAVAAPRVLIGFNREEAATFPDNSRAFMESMNRTLAYSTRGKVRVESLIVDQSKPETVRRLRELSKPFPFEKVWSCYLSGSRMCARCESCQRYLRAVAS